MSRNTRWRLFLVMWLKLLQFNPMTAAAADRVQDIVGETPNFHITVLTGTAAKAQSGEEGVMWKDVDGTLVLEAGWARGQYTNKSAGCAILLGKPFRRSNVTHTWCTKKSLAGRGVAAKVVTRNTRLLVAGLYFPPPPNKNSKFPAYKKACDKLIEWLGSLSPMFSSGCWPAIAVDLNSGLGLTHDGREWQRVCSTAVGPNVSAKQRYAADALIPFLELHDLAVVQSFGKPLPTFFGNKGGSSQIDFWIIPRSSLEAVRSEGPLYNMGRKLQVINTKAPRDHVPTHTVCWYEHPPPANRSAKIPADEEIGFCIPGTRWDRELLAESLRKGARRADFLRELEEKMQERRGKWERAQRMHQTTDKEWGIYIQALHDAGAKFFSAAARQQTEHKIAAKKRIALLKKRRELRCKLETEIDEKV